MITVIVCSINPTLLNIFAKSLESTIGLTYELLAFNNIKANKNICAVYNDLAKKAKFSCLCFVHEDVVFETLNWGVKVIDYFKANSDWGLIGIAGGKYKSGYFSGWYNKNEKSDCCNIHHSTANVTTQILLKPHENSQFEEVVCLDGVFICAKKSVFENLQWNEQLLKGFHFYDIDFSLRAALKHKVAVVFDIDLIHNTQGGNYGNAWIKEAIIFHEQMKFLMPASTRDFKLDKPDKSTILCWLDRLKNERISFSFRLQWVFKQALWKYPFAWYKILVFLIYRPLKMSYLHNVIKDL